MCSSDLTIPADRRIGQGFVVGDRHFSIIHEDIGLNHVTSLGVRRLGDSDYNDGLPVQEGGTAIDDVSRWLFHDDLR